MIKSALEYLSYNDPIQIAHTADCPSKTGLGSSSSFLVGLINTLHAMRGRRISREDLASTAIHIEQNLLKECIGYQDSTWAAHGGLNEIEFRKDGTTSVRPITISAEFRAYLEAHVMLWFTGNTRVSHNVTSQYVPTLKEKQSQHKKMLILAQQGIKAIYEERVELLARLINLSWKIKRSLSPSISTEKIDEICRAAKNAGALGAKLIGGGGGGCIMMIVPPNKKYYVRKALSGLAEIPVKFDTEGSKIVYHKV